MQNPIIFIGLNKTGTARLTQILQDHYQINALHSVQRFDDVREGLKANNTQRVTELLSTHEAYLDGNWWRILPQLLDLFPNIRLIHTTRDYDCWVNSRTAHILRNRIIGQTPEWQHINYDDWLIAWNENHTLAKELNLTSIDITGETNNPGIEILPQLLGQQPTTEPSKRKKQHSMTSMMCEIITHLSQS